MWNCKICNKKRKAEKKVELYKTPNYLIIQLKRFKQKKNVNGKSVLGNKNDTFIEYKEILNLNNIFNESFKIKGDEYTNLLFYIFRQEYQNINNENIKIKLIQNIFGNDSLIKKSYIFLVESMKDMKPEVRDRNNHDRDNEEILLRNFLNIENKLYKNG